MNCALNSCSPERRARAEPFEESLTAIEAIKALLLSAYCTKTLAEITYYLMLRMGKISGEMSINAKKVMETCAKVHTLKTRSRQCIVIQVFNHLRLHRISPSGK